MEKIGFRNFRKFTDFPSIELGGITILIGGNNAGKSTLVKAMLLMRDFLQTKIIINSKNIFSSLKPDFKFDTEHVSIGSFKRAFCRNSQEGEDTITFNLGIKTLDIQVEVRGDRTSDSLPVVTSITINDTESNTKLIYDYSIGKMSAEFGLSENNKVAARKKEEEEAKILLLNEQLSKCKDLDQISKIKLEIERAERAIQSLKGDYSENSEPITIDFVNHISANGVLLLPELVNNFIYFSNTSPIGDKRTKKIQDTESKKIVLRAKTPLLNTISQKISMAINGNVIEYIYAHSVNQQVFYNIVKDSNDYITRTIHDFYQARITEGDDEFNFIQRWMKEFEIGSSLTIESLEGEAYRVIISDEENPKGIDLADKGMGSIQLTILLLRIATLMRKYKELDLTILLEEPEQNLHPALQSKLVELLYDVHINYDFQFIVETHSEYLVRNSQVLVAKNNKSTKPIVNPFRIYYIDKAEGIYPMNYNLNGKFDRDFAPGFFDVADNAALELFDLED